MKVGCWACPPATETNLNQVDLVQVPRLCLSLSMQQSSVLCSPNAMASQPQAPVALLPLDDLLAAATEEMAVGQMIHQEAFSLFEAMSACELGNPKMDTTAAPTTSVSALFQEGLAPVQLNPAQQLAIMNQLLVMESAHYCFAAPLACSVYTSLYMMQPERLQDTSPLLHAYCESLGQTSTAGRWLVYHGAVFEEEDFYMLATGLPCDAGAPAGTAVPEPQSTSLALLDVAITLAQQQQQGAVGEEAAVYAAIVQRLCLRKDLQLLLLNLKQKSLKSLTACGKHVTAALQALEACTASQQAGTAAEPALGFVDNLNRHLLGPAPPRTVHIPAPEAALSALQTMLQQIKAALTVTDASGFREVHGFIQRFASLRAGVVARSAAHYLVAGDAWRAAASLPTPARSEPTDNGAASPASAESKSGDCSWALDRPLLCEAMALPVSPAICDEVELFLEQAAIAVGNWAQAMLVNPCRQRRRLRRGLDDWANLYQHALNADLSSQFTEWMSRTGWKWKPGQAGPVNAHTGEPDLQGPLATWVEAHTASVQMQHLLLGFPLELYRAQEYTSLYWYCVHLSTVRKSALQLLHSVNAPAGGKKPLSLEAGKGAKGKARAKAAPPPPPSPATVRRQSGLLADIVHAEQTANMASSLVRLVLALQQAGLINEPSWPFNTQREWFEQRFGCFHAPNLVRPEPLSFEHFQDAVSTEHTSASQLLAMAAEGFGQVKKMCDHIKQQQQAAAAPSNAAASSILSALSVEQLSELAIMDRVSAANRVAAMLVARSLSDAGKQGDAKEGSSKLANRIAVTFDFSLHASYPTLKVKSINS